TPNECGEDACRGDTGTDQQRCMKARDETFGDPDCTSAPSMTSGLSRAGSSRTTVRSTDAAWHSSRGFWLCHPGIRREFRDARIDRVADEVLQIQQRMAALPNSNAVRSFGKGALHE